MMRAPKELDERLRQIQRELQAAGLLNVKLSDVGRVVAKHLGEININVSAFKGRKRKNRGKGENFEII